MLYTLSQPANISGQLKVVPLQLELLCMKNHLFYGLLYIILLPFALLFGFCALIFIIAALQAPTLLIPAFVVVCNVIYIIASLIFYIKAVQQGNACRPSLRDLIRINAFVIVLPAVVLLLNSIAVVANPTLIASGIEQMKQLQPMPVADTTMISLLTMCFYVLLVYSVALLIHIPYTFRLMKDYQWAFGIGSKTDDEIDNIGRN